MIAAFVPVAAVPVDVPLRNSSFSEGLAPNGVPNGWQRYAGGGKDQRLSVVDRPDGKGKALLFEDGDADAEFGIIQTVPAKAGETYRARVLVRAVEGAEAAGAHLQLRFLPGDKYVQVPLAPRGTEFTEVTATMVAPPGTERATIYLYSHKVPTPKVMVSEVSLQTGAAPPPAAPAEIPAPVPPVYTKVKDLHLTTRLVHEGKPAATIVAPDSLRAPATALQAAIRQITGVTVPVVGDTAPEASVPLRGNLILLGNRSTNRAIRALYDRSYTFLDRKYPGPGGHEVRSLHNPFGDGRNVLFAGGSDAVGVGRAAEALVKRLQTAGGARGELSVGWLMEVRLGEGLTAPKTLKECEIWEASRMYGSSGYFGWNILSKWMALYYMTGDENALKEFLRLAFPDAAAIKQLETDDGERIENKTAPLSGPYHYAAHMTTLLWDLIEESPLLSDADRLRVTNALSKQLAHRVSEGVYGATAPHGFVGDRHGDWSATALYCLGRYFQKDYPSPVWQRCLDAGDQYFSVLHRHHWMAGNNDHLFWYTSYYDPILNYLLLSGDRVPLENGNLRKALRNQEILATGLENDWGVHASSLGFLNKAAYLTGDGRWLYFRERTNLDTNVFRLGQSFWPDEDQKPAPPEDLVGRWTIQEMTEPMWRSRGSGIPLGQSFQWGSWRSALGPEGDFVLLKGYNGGGRLPYHTCVISELRLAGRTLLKGYRTQVLSSADGLVEPLVPMDGALLHNGVLGRTVSAVMEVPRLAFANWRRTLAQRTGRYALVVDDLTFRTDSDNVKLETTWETPGAAWVPKAGAVRIGGAAAGAVPAGWVGLPAVNAKAVCGPGTPEQLLSRLKELNILLLKAPAPGTWVDVTFEIERPVRGEVFADLLNYADRGIVRLSLDGRPAAPDYDHYAAAVAHARVSLGTRDLAAGAHVLRVEVVGKRPEAEKHYVGLSGLSIRPEGAPAAGTAGATTFDLRTCDAMEVRPGAITTMEWRGAARSGGQRVVFHLLGRNPDGGDDTLACARVAENAAALALPEPALAVAGEFRASRGDLVVLSAAHLLGHRVLQAGVGAPLLTAGVAVDVDWDFAAGALCLDAPEATQVSLSLASAEGLLLDGKPANARAAGALFAVQVPAGRHTLSGARPAAAPVAALAEGLAGLLADGRRQRAALAAAPAKSALPAAPAWPAAMAGSIGGRPVSAAVIPAPESTGAAGKAPDARSGAGGAPGPAGRPAEGSVRRISSAPALLALAEGKTVHLLGADGKEIRRFEADGDIRAIHWWPEPALLLAGCKDEKVIAFDLDGRRRWVFASEMHREVYEAGKQYWFKSAPGHEGVHGLATGRFDGGKSRCFVGSACTLEILDEAGALVKRLPLFWGPGRRFLLVDNPDGSTDLLVARWHNDSAAMAVVNSKTLARTGTGFFDVPAGHTFVGGWDVQNREDNFATDLDGDGKPEVVSAINGTWNRVAVWDAAGKPLANAQFGPGVTGVRTNLRALDVADLDGDGKQEIVVGLAGGLVVALDRQCRKAWARALPSPPVALRCVRPGAGVPWVVVGCDDGTLLALDGKGEVLRAGKVAGRPVEMQVLATPAGPLLVVATDKGDVAGFRVVE